MGQGMSGLIKKHKLTKSKTSSSTRYRKKRHQSTPAALESISQLIDIVNTEIIEEKFPNKRSESMVTRNTLPRTKHDCSGLQHISVTFPDTTSTSTRRSSSAFYSEFHESVGADEVAKVRRCIKGGGQPIAKSNTKRTLSQDVTISLHTEHNNKNIKKKATAGLKGVGLRSNSCSTLFVDQTLDQPDLSEILSCVSTAIYMSFKKVFEEKCLPEFDSIFDEKKHPLTKLFVSSDYRTRLLSVMEIHDFLSKFFKAAVLKASTIILTMVYITRLHNAGLVLQPANWKRVILGAVILASKVWDDQ
eukprot:Ihof_evm4s415 gene=Ihof_evmTU4s415